MEISFTAAKKTDTRTDKDWTLIKIESAVPWQKDQVFGTWNLILFGWPKIAHRAPKCGSIFPGLPRRNTKKEEISAR